MKEDDTRKALSAAPREQFDYTQWRREYFDDMTTEEFEGIAIEWAKSHPGITGSYAIDTSKDSV